MLARAFTGEFDDTDRDRALGGLHVIITEGAHVVARAAVVQGRVLYDGRALRAGYVEAVAVDQPRRGRGYAAIVMNEASASSALPTTGSSAHGLSGERAVDGEAPGGQAEGPPGGPNRLGARRAQLC
jgi:GNAT superfamily N-acetyltransferase